MIPMAVDLHADCANCVGLCCVGTAFAKSSDFAFDRQIGTPCPNLQDNYGCAIHTELRDKGMAGCTIFDCVGAGQKLTQVTFKNKNWRDTPIVGPQMYLAFSVMRLLHELLWYITDAMPRATEPTASDLHAAYGVIEELTNRKANDLFKIDVNRQRDETDVLLRSVSDAVRSTHPSRSDYNDADLSTKSLANTDLRGSTFRNALLLGMDLHECDLRDCDFLGAKMRNANVRGADLSSALYLTQMQINAADGDAATRLPERVYRPNYWI